MPEKIFLCRDSELADGEMRQIVVAAKDAELAVYKSAGKVYVTDDLCTHGMVALTGGDLEGTTIYCPLHGGAFDICTGKALEKPCTVALKTYPVVVEGDDIFCLYGA